MATFQASLVNAGTGLVSITIGTGCTSISITDESNYDSTDVSSGHERANFNKYRKVVVEYTDGSKYTLSSIGDGDAAIDPASTSNDTFTAQLNSGDGVYKVTLYTVPSWGSSPTYILGDIVVKGGGGIPYKFYKSLQNANTNKDPAVETDWWEEITEITGFTSKYYNIQRIAVICALNCCIEEALHSAFCVIEDVECCEDDLCKNDKFMNAVKLMVVKQAIETSAENNMWLNAEKQFQLASKLCKCC